MSLEEYGRPLQFQACFQMSSTPSIQLGKLLRRLIVVVLNLSVAIDNTH